MSPSTRREEHAAATRQALLEAATELFAERGYAAVSTGQVVKRARVTRGALYHHFSDKKDLMRGVFAAADHALVERLGAEGRDLDDPAAALAATWRGFLDALADPDTRAILFVEAPAALGWREWRELDGGRALGLVVERLRALVDAGLLSHERDLTVLGHLILGALNEAGMLIATSQDPQGARERVEREIEIWLDQTLSVN